MNLTVEMSTEWFKQRLILDMVTNLWPLFDILKLWSAFDAGKPWIEFHPWRSPQRAAKANFKQQYQKPIKRCGNYNDRPETLSQK